MDSRIAPIVAALVLHTAARAQDPLSARIERIRGKVREIAAELDSLSRALAASQAAGAVRDSKAGNAPDSQPILAELLSEKRKRLAAAATQPYDLMAAGFVFDPVLSIGMQGRGWTGHWGWMGAGTAWFTENTRRAGAEATVLRELHRFSLFRLLETRLYGFAGAGFIWRRESYPGYFPGMPAGPLPPSRRDWYESPDFFLRGRLGAGTEVGGFGLGGIRGAPEVGLQASRFLSRYQDSDSWQELERTLPGFEERPKSDFDLVPYFAFQLDFYFR